MTEKKEQSAAVKALLAAKTILDELKIKPFLIYETLVAAMAKTLDEKTTVQLGVKYEDIQDREGKIAELFFNHGFDVAAILKPLDTVRAWKLKHDETGVTIIIAAYFLFEDGTRKCPASNGKNSLSFDCALLENMKNKNIGGRWFAAPTPTDDYICQTYDGENLKMEAFRAFKIMPADSRI